MYLVLFLGLPVLGVLLFAYVWRRMVAARVPSPPVVQLFVAFAAYGAVLLFGLSEAFGVWSGMHSLAAVGVLFVGLPWLLVQGVALLRARPRSVYHRAAAALSLAFPLALGALYVLAFWIERGR